MATNKPKFIDKFWPVSTITASRTGSYKRILAERMERSKYLIENTFGVKAERVVDIFIKAYLASDKDYPAPVESVYNPKNAKDSDLYNQYILFLWQYYVKDKSKNKKVEKESKPKDLKVENNLDNSQDTKTNKGGGLSLYEGIKEEDLVDEQIDERILKLLGLQDIFDIDYGTYLSLLKERLVTISMGDKKIPRDEQVLLQEEFKRVKGKVGRFKIRSKKISADSIGVSGPVRVSRQQFFLAGKVSVPDLSKDNLNIGSSLKKDIEAIKESIISIASILAEQNTLFLKEQERQRKLAENLKRSKKEGDLESKTDKIKSLVSKILTPFRGFLDKILNFITTVLLGRLVYKFIDWISDPNNKKKVDLLVRFIGDWWPSLLAGFILFATPLGSFIRTIIGTVTKLSIHLGKKGIPKLLKFIKANPVAATLIGGSIAAGIGAYAATQQVSKTRETEKKKDPTIILPEDTAKSGKTPGIGQLTREQIQSRGLNMFRGGGLIKPKKQEIKPQPIKNIAFEEGGTITNDTGLKITGAGKDTQLIAARPGEVVISKEAVDKYGANFFLALNKSGGGTNIPKMVNNIQLAAGGGLVGGTQPMTSPLSEPSKLVSMKKISSMRRTESDYIKPSFNNKTISKSIEPAKLSTNNQKDKDNKIRHNNKINNSTSSGSQIIPKFSIAYYPSPEIFAMLIPVETMKPMSETAKESARPIEQKMPFVVPLINNIVNVLSKSGKEESTKIQKPNININSNIKSYIPEPPVKKSGSKMITLPPLNTTNDKSGYNSTPKEMSTIREIPDFPVFLPSAHRKNNIQIYGIAGIV